MCRPPMDTFRPSSSSEAFLNLLKTMIGAGILTLPWATAQVGLIVSLVGLPIILYRRNRPNQK